MVGGGFGVGKETFLPPALTGNEIFTAWLGNEVRPDPYSHPVPRFEIGCFGIRFRRSRVANVPEIKKSLF